MVSTSRYAPHPTAASMAPPMDGPSSTSRTSTLRFITFAMIFFQSGLFAPPPQILVRSILMPSFLATSRESRSPKATPSRTACVMSALVVSMDIPKNTPLASGLLCGDRSPIRYGRKNTLFSPSFSIGACSAAKSLV